MQQAIIGTVAIEFIPTRISWYICRESSFKKICEGLQLEPETDNCLGASYASPVKVKGKGTFIIWTPKYDTSTLLHEIVHTVDSIMKWFSFHPEDTELRALLTEHIYKEFTKDS